MQRKRTPQQQRHNSSAVRPPAHEAHEWSRQHAAAPSDQFDDETDGQLGPDELPDPAEVIMSREAKRHR